MFSKVAKLAVTAAHFTPDDKPMGTTRGSTTGGKTRAAHWVDGRRTVECIFKQQEDIDNDVPFDIALSADDGCFPVCGPTASSDYLRQELSSTDNCDATYLSSNCIILEIDGQKVAGMCKADIRRHLIECSDDGEISVQFVKPSQLFTSLCYHSKMLS
jgi:hypothetical protein